MDPGRARAGLPGFVVIGAQKAASTFLQDQMAMHPGIEMPDGETRTFEDPFYSEQAVEELATQFQRTGVVRGIKRPDYLAHPEVPERLHHYLPDARLLAVLRDPVARSISSYYHFVRHSFVPLLPVDDAFTLLLDGAWAADYPRSVEILSFGLYGEHLKRYRQFFTAEQLLIFEQSALTAAPDDSLRRAFEFVGVDPSFVPPRLSRVSGKGVYSPARLRLLRSKNRLQFRYSDSLDRRDPRPATPWGSLYAAALVGVDRTVLARFDSGRPAALSAPVRRRLEDYYRADGELLREVLGPTAPSLPWLR